MWTRASATTATTKVSRSTTITPITPVSVNWTYWSTPASRALTTDAYEAGSPIGDCQTKPGTSGTFGNERLSDLVDHGLITSTDVEQERRTAKKVYRPDIYRQAAEELIAAGEMQPEDFPDFDAETGFRPPQTEFIDGIAFDGRKPNAYLEQFPIGLKGEDQL